MIRTEPNTGLDDLLHDFARTHHTKHLQLLSMDGLNVAAVSDLDAASIDQLAALCSGLTMLADSAADEFGHHGVVQNLVELERLWMLQMIVPSHMTGSNELNLMVAVDSSSDIGQMAAAVNELAEAITGVVDEDELAIRKNSLL